MGTEQTSGDHEGHGGRIVEVTFLIEVDDDLTPEQIGRVIEDPTRWRNAPITGLKILDERSIERTDDA